MGSTKKGKKEYRENLLCLFKPPHPPQKQSRLERETLIKMDLAFFWDLISATALCSIRNQTPRNILIFFGFFEAVNSEFYLEESTRFSKKRKNTMEGKGNKPKRKSIIHTRTFFSRMKKKKEIQKLERERKKKK